MATGKRLLLKREQGINSSPTWSPNGRYLAAVLSMEGNPDIFLYDLKKKVWKQLTTHFGIDTEPAWSPNGKKLGFIGQEIGREINTIGAKSFNVEMQKLVIQMKD